MLAKLAKFPFYRHFQDLKLANLTNFIAIDWLVKLLKSHRSPTGEASNDFLPFRFGSFSIYSTSQEIKCSLPALVSRIPCERQSVDSGLKCFKKLRMLVVCSRDKRRQRLSDDVRYGFIADYCFLRKKTIEKYI